MSGTSLFLPEKRSLLVRKIPLIGVRAMETYTFYIEDDRYSVPTLMFVTTWGEDHARRLALDELAEPHHIAVEVRIDDEPLFVERRWLAS
jgi:hypothetical protein